MPRKLLSIALLSLTLCGTGARAEDAGQDMFSFGGFGTLGVVHSSERKADFTTSLFKPSGAGYSRAWSAGVDSLLAGQMTARFTPRVSAVLQIVAEQNADASYTPHVEWANISYQLTQDFRVRIGRTVLPIFMLSDSRKVGYANPWVRPPTDVYGMVPVTSNDGIDASYRMSLGNATDILHLTAGQSDSTIPPNGGLGEGTGKARNLLALVNTFEQGFFTLHFAIGHARVTLTELAPLFGAFRQFGAPGAAIADKYDVNKSPLNFRGIGASYDPGKWFVMTEWNGMSASGVLGKQSSWYASGGYRHGKLTPYLTYARTTADNASDPGLNTASLTPAQAATATDLNARLNAILIGRAVQNTVSVGARWDFAKNLDLKVQMDQIHIGTNSVGILSNIQPGFRPGGTVRVLSATVDFVF